MSLKMAKTQIFPFFFLYFSFCYSQVKKFKFLCAILRVSVALWKHQSKNLDKETESSHSHEGFNFKAVFNPSLNLFFFFSYTELKKI